MVEENPSVPGYIRKSPVLVLQEDKTCNSPDMTKVTIKADSISPKNKIFHVMGVFSIKTSPINTLKTHKNQMMRLQPRKGCGI